MKKHGRGCWAGFDIPKRVACADARVKAVIGLGIPVAPADEKIYDFEFLKSCGKPKLLVSGANDQFGPRKLLEGLHAALPEPKKLVIIDGADHFFEGHLKELREAIHGWVGADLQRRILQAYQPKEGSDG